jgi:hypothetical protein
VCVRHHAEQRKHYASVAQEMSCKINGLERVNN